MPAARGVQRTSGDPDAEVAILPLDPREQGATFALDPQSYRRLASACLSARTDLMTIRKPRNDQHRAVVDLDGSDALLTISIDAELGFVHLDLFATLDSPQSACVLSVEDSGEGWQRVRQMMAVVLGAR
jgi:hypothetical protein